MPRKKRAPVSDAERTTWLRVLPSAGPDVVHILDGRRVVTVELPPRGPRGSPANLARVHVIGAELARRKLNHGPQRRR